MDYLLSFFRKRRGSLLAFLSRRIFMRMSLFEKALAFVCTLILVASTGSLIHSLYLDLSDVVPTHGGTMEEGIIGAPRFINPLLAMTDSDQDLTTLVYSGLLRNNPDGTLLPDLAKTLPVQLDEKTYKVSINPDATFHDGVAVTADDIVYTMKLVQNPIIRSPLQGDFTGVEVEKIDTYTVVFRLREPYPPFIYNLTIGILPKHIWEHVPIEQFAFSEYNIVPIGSGPYAVDSIDRNNTGAPRRYVLKAFDNYIHGRPYIRTIVCTIFKDQIELSTALLNRRIDSALTTQNITIADVNKYSFPMKRVFTVFFNQNTSSILKDKSVREALEKALDREELIQEVLLDNGLPVYEPLPYIFLPERNSEISTIEQTSLEEARQILEEDGWRKNTDSGIMEKKIENSIVPLSITLHTADVEELVETAESIKNRWSSVGVEVTIQKFDTASLITQIVRPRQFEALLFGQVIGRDNDMYAYWHSSQRLDPGLNVSLYTNRNVDTVLETLRNATSSQNLADLYNTLNTTITSDIPALFLYVPLSEYHVNPRIKGINAFPIVHRSERFLGIETWYIQTKRIPHAFID